MIFKIFRDKYVTAVMVGMYASANRKWASTWMLTSTSTSTPLSVKEMLEILE